MNQAEKAELLEQIEKWNDVDEFSRCIEAIEAIPEQERDYLLTVKLSRAYSNLAVLGDHGEHGTDSEVDGNLIQHAIRLLESVRTQGENDPYNDLFCDLLEENAKAHPKYQGDYGDWLNWTVPDTDCNLPIFASGWGDGYYPVYFGYDAKGEVCAVYVRFIDIEASYKEQA